MNIYLKNHDYSYEVQSMLQIFFPNLKFILISDLDLGRGYDFIVISEFLSGSNIFETSIVENNVIVRKERAEVVDDNFKRALKISIFRTLCLYTNKVPKWGILTGIRPTKLVYDMLDIKKDKEIVEHLVKTYMVHPEKAELAVTVAKNEKSILNKNNDDGYHLYISIPFCKTKCVYCSFTSFSLDKYEKQGMTDIYVEMLVKELKENAPLFKGRRLKTIYIGGGTPSSITAKQIEEILQTVETYYDLSSLLEYTFEAGRADTITKEKLEVLRKYKVNRISINPQTMKDETLNRINRSHTVQEFLDVYAMILDFGFEVINVDLIFGLVGESYLDFEESLKQVIDLKPHCITIHTLSVKRGAILKDTYGNDEIFESMAEEELRTLPLMGLTKNGYVPYYLYRQKNMIGTSSLENIGFSKPDLECVYNVISMEEIEDVVAFGAGATSKRVFDDMSIERVFNMVSVEEYINRIDEMIERKRDLYTR